MGADLECGLEVPNWSKLMDDDVVLIDFDALESFGDLGGELEGC